MARHLFIADPMDQLNPRGDSTLAIARQAIARGDEVAWADGTAVYFARNHVGVKFHNAAGVEAKGSLALGELKDSPLADFDVVWIRTDPPFDMDYHRFCWLLAFEENRVRIVNAPSALLRYHEKILPIEAFYQGYLKEEDVIETYIDASDKAARDWEGSDVVAKPFLGFGGRDIERHSLPEGREQVVRYRGIVQPFMKEIHETGDRRILYAGGRIFGHFSRFPAEGGFVSNLAQGGEARAGELNAREKGALDRLGKFLRARGIVFAGADLIGDKISEVNITSPTGLMQLEALRGESGAETLIQAALDE